VALTRLLLAWGAVALWETGWWAVACRIGRLPVLPAIRDALTWLLTESLLLTLFAGLWFASLGSGGAWLLFLVVAGLVELPWRLRSPEPVRWPAVAGGLVRVVVAGLGLAQILG
jgi:hypothetical protein